MNMIVIHKQSKWSKFKRRFSSWFSSDKVNTQDSIVLPQIIVTSPEDITDGDQKHDLESAQRAAPPPPPPPAKYRKAEKDDLAKAHQNVIAEMRVNLAEARGKDNGNQQGSETNSSQSQKTVTTNNRRSVVVDPNNKPPVPPTKAAAVAKIRQAIATAKQESCQDLSSSSSKATAKSESCAPSVTPLEPVANKDNKQTTTIPSQNILSLSQDENLNKDKVPNNRSKGNNETEGNSNNTANDTTTDAEKEARKAAIRAKIRSAILNAAASGALAENDKSQITPKSHLNSNIVNTTLNNNSIPSIMQNKNIVQRNNSITGNAIQRRSSTGTNQEKPKETIWEFFEQGNKKGTCKTCGYVVGCKNNKGNLTRHLSLVHQREYKLYTAKMEKNWTNGMMEKNLNMKIPANL